MNRLYRQSNIELLRIVLMIMIIVHHITVHGLGLKNIGQPGFTVDQYTYYELAINSFAVIAVNTFIFISGYFGIKFKLKSILSLIAQAVFYSVILYLMFSYIDPSQGSIKNFVQSFFPVSTNAWWFITLYVGLYFMAPILNKGTESMERNDLKVTIAGLFFLNCFSGFLFGSISADGFSIFNFISIYVAGRYIGKYKIGYKYAPVALCFLTITLFGLSLVLLNTGKLDSIWHLYYYNNPLLIASAIMLFFVFNQFHIKSNKAINIIASSVLGIYMLHDYYDVRMVLASFVYQMKIDCESQILVLFSLLLILTLSIFMIGFFIDMIRRIFFEKIIGFVFGKFETNRINANPKGLE